MDLRFYNFDFELLHIEPDIVSSNWTVYNNAIGSFEIHIPLKSDVISLIKNSFDLAACKLLTVVQGDLQGIVTGVLLKDDCAIFGKTCNWLLSKRVLQPFRSTSINVSQDGESIARWCVETAFGDVENFILGEPVGFDPIYDSSNAFWRSSCTEVSSVVSSLMKASDGGHFVYFDFENKNWVFNTTKNSSAGLVVSTALKNAHDMEFSYDISKYVSDGWFESEVYDSDGLLTAFKWNHTEKETKDGIYRWTGVIDASSEAEAQNGLLLKSTESHTVSQVKGLNFKKDFNLGDYIRIQFEKCGFLKTALALVDGVILSFENNNCTQKIIFKEVTN